MSWTSLNLSQNKKAKLHWYIKTRNNNVPLPPYSTMKNYIFRYKFRFFLFYLGHSFWYTSTHVCIHKIFLFLLCFFFFLYPWNNASNFCKNIPHCTHHVSISLPFVQITMIFEIIKLLIPLFFLLFWSEHREYVENASNEMMKVLQW